VNRRILTSITVVAALVTVVVPVSAAANVQNVAHSSNRAWATSPTSKHGLATTTPVEHIRWAACKPPVPNLQCAQVKVPLDWSRPNGKKIKLAVIRHLASRPKERIGSMFINPGGPGDTGVGLVRDGGAELDAWGAGRFDIVSWDPRGDYASEPVHCFTSQSSEARFWRGVSLPTTPAASRAYRRKTVELARRCGQVCGKLLAHISTADTVRDLDTLRKLVGDRTITYVGLSYGTFIGETYANLFPHRVRAMMLDGVIDPVAYTKSAEARIANGVSPTDGVFEQFVALCQRAGPARCALAGHSETVARRVARLFKEARRAPIPAPDASPPGSLSYGDLLLSAFAPLRDPHLWPQFAKDLNAAANGNASNLETAARLARTPAAFAEATKSAAIQCLDGPARHSSLAWPKVIGHLTKISKLQGPILGWWVWAPCASNWPARSTDRYAGPWNAKTKHPILVIGTRYDPNTSYRNAQRVAHLLGNAVLLTHAGYGHLSFKDPSQCVEKARVRYLVDLVTPPPGTVCPADQVPFPSASSRRQP
jgi:pimeloyl-ACP methyl ester carboxylesterase